MRAARLVLLCVGLFGVLVAATASAAPPGAPKGLRGFELRPNETPTHTFSRTPAFAWSPVRGASCYEFELATSRSFDGSSVFWSNVSEGTGSGKACRAVTITALVVPRRELAWQILALNTEKAHNLRDKSLEVIRIYRNLIEESPGKTEKDFSYYLEEASFVTMGLCYEKNPRFSGAVYNSFVRRLTEAGMERQMAEAIVEGLAEADMTELATKADLARVEAALRTEIVELKAEMFRFMMLQAVAIVGLTVTLIKLLP